MIPLLLFSVDITSFFVRALFQLPARFTRYKHPRLFQSGGPGFWPGWARSCDHVSSRRNVQNPRDGGHADIPENAHPRGTANPTKCAQGETLRNCRVYRSWTSTRVIPLPPPPPSPSPCRSVYKWNRDTDACSPLLARFCSSNRLIFKPIIDELFVHRAHFSRWWFQFHFWI